MANFFKILVVTLAATLIGCSNRQPDKDLSFNVLGNVDGGAGKVVYLKVNLENGFGLLDSVTIKNDNTFFFNALTEKVGFFTLQLKETGEEITIAADTCQKIEIKTSATSFSKNYSVSGSPESEKICELERQLNITKNICDSLSKVFFANINDKNLPTIKHNIDSVYFVAEKKQRIFSENFLKENPNSLACLVCLSQYIAPRKPIFDPIEDFSFYEQTAQKLVELYPTNVHVNKMRQYVEKLKTLKRDNKPLPGMAKTGFAAPEIALPNIKGDTIKLSDFRGKYVLVDFWASWSNLSQQNNELLAKIYRKYQSAGFTILQVAIDNNREKWKEAVKNQKLMWYNVSDLKLWDNAAAVDYGVKQLPSNFLVYPDGIVGQSNLTIQELDETLSGLIGNKIVKKKVETPSEE